MKFRRRKKSTIELNLTPMIDVVLLLLIFFMVSTTFTKETRLSLELPEASTGQPAVGDENTLEIVISPAGHFGINGQMLINDEPQTLIEALKKTMGDKKNLPALVIAADAKSPHQAVVTAMDAAGKLGFVHIRIASVMPTQQ
ncbi:MAG TPA: biopolymer transporter ExbD [Pseudomonadales bacterium]|nr:biopolymer transporter ExbD [Pseudomonadales bacterium]